MVRPHISHLRPSGRCVRSLHPFQRADLEGIRRVLDPLPLFPLDGAPAHTLSNPAGRKPADSSVLIPLMNVDGEARILFQVRSARMRTHAGEVGFPGGKADPQDATLVQTALREANEELALDPRTVEMLGALPPEYSLGNKARVWPVVVRPANRGVVCMADSRGFVHSSAAFEEQAQTNEPLTSPSLASFVHSPDEVDAILPLPLSAAIDESRHHLHFFRLARNCPYVKIRAEDLVVPPMDVPLEIWGLSGWFFNRLAWRVDWLQQPKAPADEEVC